jgi:hypothetical protein
MSLQKPDPYAATVVGRAARSQCLWMALAFSFVFLCGAIYAPGLKWVSLAGFPLLWLVKGGYRWARKLATALAGFLSFVSLVVTLASLWARDEQQSSAILALPWLIATLALTVTASALFESTTLDRLPFPERSRERSFASVRKRPFQPAPATSAREARYYRFWGTLAPRWATGGLVGMWALLIVAVPYYLCTGEFHVDRFQDLKNLIVFGTCVLMYCAAPTTAFVFALLFSLPVVSGWRRPPRFLFLRPFNRRGQQALFAPIVGTMRILQQELAPLGHCYTLADADVSVSRWSRRPLLLGPLLLLMFRQRTIHRPRDLERLLVAMDRTRRRNINWCVSRRKLFPVECTTATWRQCVADLAANVDAVLFEFTGGGAGIRWELNHLAETGALPRTIFLIDDSQRASFDQAIAEIHCRGALQVVTYGPEGLREPHALAVAATDVLLRQR